MSNYKINQMEALKTYTLRSKKTDHVWEFKYFYDGEFHSFASLGGDFEKQQSDYISHRFPFSEERFVELQKDYSEYFQIILGANEIDFETFYDAYQQKTTKKQSREYWHKMKKADQINAYLGIARYNRYLKLNAWQRKVDPIRYLRNRRYEDEFN